MADNGKTGSEITTNEFINWMLCATHHNNVATAAVEGDEAAEAAEATLDRA